MKVVGAVTSSRADYGIMKPVLDAINAERGLDLYLYVTGMHLSPQFGHTVDVIEADGFRIDEKLEMLIASDSAESIAKSMGNGVCAFAQAYARYHPDIIVIVGDRFEMLPAALAALPFRIPVAHIHGGEVTFGAIDDSIRHSLTKLSHLHFVSTREYEKRVTQMGEESWRVVVSGAPSLDNINNIKLMSREDLELEFGIELDEAPILVTFHPVTLEVESTNSQIDVLLDSLDDFALPVVFTAANADTNHRVIDQKVSRYVAGRSDAFLVQNFGLRGYFSMMSCSAVMVGNSSSGIVESGSFGLPVVNIGTRQQGRVKGANVVDVDYDKVSICEGIEKALDPNFRKKIKDLKNPYGDGQAVKAIIDTLNGISVDQNLIKKKFNDI